MSFVIFEELFVCLFKGLNHGDYVREIDYRTGFNNYCCLDAYQDENRLIVVRCMYLCDRIFYIRVCLYVSLHLCKF